MRTKLLFFAFTMLTVCTTLSQDTIATEAWDFKFKERNSSRDSLDHRPICFPFWMACAIALDLEEKQQLQQEAMLYAIEVETYKKLHRSLEAQAQQRLLQLELLGKNSSLLESQLQAEKQTPTGSGTFTWSLRVLAALGAGFLLGRI